MAYNQDAIVTSSQDGVLESTRSGNMSDPSPVKPLKVAKVFPTVRKEEERPEADDSAKEKVKVAKKQVFPWLCKFNALCREAAGSRSYKRLDDLMEVYIRQVAQDVKNCYKKPNRASKVKTKMNDYLKLFHMLYRDIRRPLEHNYYLDRMSDLMAMYLDMEIKASRRGKENPRIISDRLMSALFILLENSKGHILNAILKAKFFVKRFNEICIPIIMRVLRDIPTELNDVSYVQYVLIFKKWKVLLGCKEERQEINRLAAARLTPPPGFVDNYHESDKYNGLLPVVAKGKADKFTLMLMQAPGLNVKDNTEGYRSTLDAGDNTVKNLEEAELNKPLFSEEFSAMYSGEDSKSEKRSTRYCSQIWRVLEDISSSTDDILYDSLFEEEFVAKLKRRQEAEEKQRLMFPAKKSSKVKNGKVIEKKVINSNLGCVHNSTSPAGYKDYSYSNKASQVVASVRKVPKMEADSQSQDEIIVISEDEDELEQPVKKEFLESFELKHDVEKPESNKPEEQETNRWDAVQTPVLRAVVRPENIQQLSFYEGFKEQFPQNVQEAKIETSTTGAEGVQQIEISQVREADRVEGKVTEEGDKVMNLSQEEAVVGSTSVSCDKADQPPPLDETKPASDLLLEEITKVTGVPEVNPSIWPDMDGQNFQNQSLADIFDPNDPSMFMFYPEGTGDTHNWPFSHDLILTQYDDELFAQYECGNTNAFPDFYNEQQDMIFTGAGISSPPLTLMDMMRDEPVEYQLSTTHWEDLSMMVSDTTYNEKANVSPESSPKAPEEETGPVVYIERRKGRRGKAKSKAKETNLAKKETEKINEKKTNIKEDGVRKTKQAPQRRKRVRFVSEDEDEDDVDVEPEPEPEPKKKRGRQKKTPPPVPVAPPKSPPQTNTRKPRGGSQPSSSVSKKKAQSRRR